ncbi:hypothetical protein Fmac_005466 [Flemingia macrophylla]|uniref:Uncharacterized protein n=1 Tax=Flemingia macrophylla TaxID=520843 RepID=A0ABD1N7W0_9FABA
MLATRPDSEMERLSTLYNVDVGLYMLANKGLLEEIGFDTSPIVEFKVLDATFHLSLALEPSCFVGGFSLRRV